MTREALIQNAYDVFGMFEKPERCTQYSDFEEGEFNAVLLSAGRRSLTMDELGTAAWSPLPAMNPEALAYFMPRLIELALTHTVDKDGEPFFCRFINAFSSGPKDDRFKLFQEVHRTVMADTFRFLVDHYSDPLTIEGWLEEADEGARNWRETAL